MRHIMLRTNPTQQITFFFIMVSPFLSDDIIMKPQTFAVKILPAASAASFYQIVFLDRDNGFSLSGGFQLCFQRLDFTLARMAYPSR